ncbi:MAG: MATE family efflux transporter [Alphaproteobacteria bacterium]|jgi:multidrug resistance protein, MATE family|nr:MATE family efflux transporter [Alphaproteobacteria bacterium]
MNQPLFDRMGADGPWHRRMWQLALPMILSNITLPLLGAVDTAVVGHLGNPQYLGAVSIGALIFATLYFSCNFLRMGTTGLTAQAYGADDHDELRAVLVRALVIAGLLASIMVATQTLIGWGAFSAIGASDGVTASGEVYFYARIWGAPAALSNVAMMGWFIGMQRTRPVMVLLIVVNGLNIVLDLIFVLVLDMGVSGVGWATVIADYSGLLVGGFIVRKLLVGRAGNLRWRLVLAGERIRRFVSVNTDIFIRTMAVSLAFVLFESLAARMGDLTLAANAVLMNFVIFLNYGIDGMAFAAEALTGRALGARSKPDMAAAIRVGGIWCFVIALITVLGFIVLGPVLIRGLTNLTEVRAGASTYLPWVIGMPIAAFWALFLDGVFTGTTRTRDMRNSMLFSAALFVPAALWLPDVLGNHGLWLALTLLYVIRSLSMGAIHWNIGRKGGYVEA